MSEQIDLLVVGGGPAGHAAVRAYLDAGGPGPLVMVSEDPHPPYNRPPLSKDYLRGESAEDALPLDPPEFYPGHGIELLTADAVIELRAEARQAVTRSGRTLGYQSCILATGSTPNRLPVPGGDMALALRWLDQARVLRDAAQGANSAVVIGSGFIGCEVAASLAHRGLAVTMVSNEARPQLGRLGDAVAELITGWLEAAGVQLMGNATVLDVAAGRIVQLDHGVTLSADLVLAAVGVSPRGELADRAGATMRDGRVLVDASMRTSVDGLLAAGDVALAFNADAGRYLAVEHWGEAENMGKVAGTVAAGGDASWSGPPGFWSEIGEHTLKYAAWGDGFDDVRAIHHDDGGLTVWYIRDGATVGVLTSEADDDYERGSDLVVAGSPAPQQ